MSRNQKWSDYKNLCDKHNVPASMRIAYKTATLEKIISNIERIKIEHAEPIAVEVVAVEVVAEPIAVEIVAETIAVEVVAETIAEVAVEAVAVKVVEPTNLAEYDALTDEQQEYYERLLPGLYMKSDEMENVKVVEPTNSAEYDALTDEQQEDYEILFPGLSLKIEEMKNVEVVAEPIAVEVVAEPIAVKVVAEPIAVKVVAKPIAVEVVEPTASDDEEFIATASDDEEFIDDIPTVEFPKNTPESNEKATVQMVETYNMEKFRHEILNSAGEVSDSKFHSLINTYESAILEGGKHTVEYYYDNPHQFGRLRSKVITENKYSTSSTHFSRLLRGACFGENSYDIDMVNCGATILTQMLKKEKIYNPSLEYFVENREEVMTMLQSDFNLSRDIIKKDCIISLIHGADVSNFIKQHKLTDSKGLKWLCSFARDMSNSIDKLISNTIDSGSSALIKYVEAKALKNGSSKRGVMMATLIQTIESKLCLEFKRELMLNGYKTISYQYDGIIVQSSKHKYGPQQNDLFYMTLNVEQRTGYKLNLISKPFEYRTDGYVPEFKQSMFERVMPYSWMKSLWERYCFFILANATYYIDLGFEIYNLKKGDLKETYGWIISTVDGDKKKNESKQVSFIKLWVSDPKHRKYTQAGMFAPPLRIPSDTYNFWRGFPISLEKDIVPKSCGVMLNFIKDLLKGNDEHYEYMLDWIADIIQNPCTKSNVSIMLFSVEQGSGKNTLVDILKSIIGRVYCLETCSPEEQLFGRFSKIKEHKFLTIINELSAELGHRNRDKIKNIISETDFIVDEKCKNTYQGKNWSRYLMTTNNINALHIEQSDRRFVMFECSKEHVGDTEYFNKIRDEIDDMGSCLALFNMLKNRKIVHHLARDRPKTDVYNMVQSNAKCPIIMWLIEHCNQMFTDGNEYGEVFQAELFKLCKEWMSDNFSEYNVTAKRFGQEFGKLYNPGMNAKQDGLDEHSRPQNRPKLAIYYERLAKSLEHSKSI